jgi:hypothetical protein
VPELETMLTQVWNPEIRPLAEEAWRSYNAGAIRAAIAATRTAVTADVIGKVVHVADDGEADAVAFRRELDSAQAKGLTPDGVRAMQAIEDKLLAKAVAFELIDSIDQRELERIREDRNLCVHPSLRSFSEVYEPRPETARAHLATALDTLLTRPPTQGRKAVAAFEDYTCDSSFVPSIAHIQVTFFDRVRSAARANIARVAAKHALRELDPDGRLPAAEYADRAAVVLRAFAQRDRELVRGALTAERERFQRLDGGTQLRAMARLGEQDYFWDLVDEGLADRLQQLVLELQVPAEQWDPLPLHVAAPLAVVRSDYARVRLPALEHRFNALAFMHRLNVVATAPAPYFVPAVIDFLRRAGSYRLGEEAGQLLVQHAPFLTVETLKTALTAWASNSQCREAAQMPDLAVDLFRSTAYLGADQAAAFVTFLGEVQALAKSGDGYYRYPALEVALAAAGHLQVTPA